MSQTNCPSCGAPLAFIASHSLIAICDFCKSTVIRHDLNLEIIGKMSDVKEDHSPLQLGVNGTFGNHGFRIVGRLQVRFDRGMWNEWYCLLDDGSAAWIGESNGQLTFLTRDQGPSALSYDRLELGREVLLESGLYHVVEKHVARVIGAEGELPFQVMGGYHLNYADLRSTQGRFVSIDFSGDTPLVYSGPIVTLKSLGATGLRKIKAYDSGQFATRGNDVDFPTESLNCPSCAAPLPVNVQGQIQRIGCPNCGSLLANDDKNLQIIRTWSSRVLRPDIPLGSEGHFENEKFKVIGVVVKFVIVEDEFSQYEYPWLEYLLFNPYLGYRWLVQDGGHFTYIEPTTRLPAKNKNGSVTYHNKVFRFNQAAENTVKYVLGEFYWQVKWGDQAFGTDYVNPPHLISEEVSHTEHVWSVGTYLNAQKVWEIFNLEDAPPVATNVLAHQPFEGKALNQKINRTYGLLMGVLLILGIAHYVISANETVATLTARIDPNTPVSTASTDPNQNRHTQWTDVFDIQGFNRAVEFDVSATGLQNNYLALDLALVNDETGEIFVTTHALEAWHGDGWSEESESANTLFASVPAGKYILRAEPTWGQGTGKKAPYSYTVKVVRDPPRLFPLFIAGLLLSIFPILGLLREASFSAKRAQED